MENLILEEEFKQFEYQELSPLRRFFKDQFNWPWKLFDMLEFITYGFAGIINCAIFSSSLDNALVVNDSQRYPLLYVLSICTPIAALYSMLLLKIRSNLWLNLAITFILVVAPLVILIVLITTASFMNNLYLAVAVIFIPGVCISFALHKIMRELLFEKIGNVLGGFVSISLVIVFNITFTLAICLITLDPSTVKKPINLIIYPAVLYILITGFIWVAIHSIVFAKQPSEIQLLKNEVMHLENPSMRVQTLLSRSPDMLNEPPEGLIQQNMHHLASVAIYLALLGVEIGLISVLSNSDSGTYPTSALYMAGFYLIAMPLFLFAGTICSASNLKKEDKFCMGLLLFALGPTLGLMALSFTFYETSTTYYLGLIIGVGFPAMIIYWLSMALIYDYSRKTYQYFSAICCLILLVPLGVVWPFYEAGGMKKETFWGVLGVLFFGGVLVLGIFLLQLLRRLSKEIFQLMAEVYRFSGFDLSQYVYSTGFLLGFALLGWMCFKRLSYSNDWIGGFIPGCYTIFGFMIIGTILVHRVTLYVPDADGEPVSMKEIITNSLPPPTVLQQQYNVKKQKYQVVIAISGVLATFGISIPILATAGTDAELYAGVTIIVGLFTSTVLVLLLVELKSVLRHFGEVVISYTMGCCWIFLLIPFVCIVPVSLGSARDSEELRSVTSWSIGSILLLFMVGVSVGSITLNLMFKKMEHEKIAKYCCSQVQEILKQNGVKAKLRYLRTMYDNFSVSGAGAVETVLQNGTVFFYHDLGDSQTDFRYSKEILTVNELNKKKAKGHVVIVEEKSNATKGISLINMLRKLCTQKGEDDKVLVKQKLEPEELVGIEVSHEVNIIPTVPDAEKAPDWCEQFKENIKKSDEKHKTILKSALFKLKAELTDEPLVSNEDIPEVKLHQQTKEELMECEHFKLLESSFSRKKRWIKAVFNRFATGMVTEDGEPWMNLGNLRQFIRLSGLKQYISNAACDILYVRLTRKYNPANLSMTHVKLNFKEFYPMVFQQLGKLRYPRSSSSEASDKIFKEEIYPNLVSNLSYLQQYLPPDAKFDTSAIADISSLVLLDQPINHSVQEEEAPNNSKQLESDDNSSKPVKASRRYSQKFSKGRLSSILVPKTNFMGGILNRFSACSRVLFKGILLCLGKAFGYCLYCLMPTQNIVGSSKSRVSKIYPDASGEILERKDSPSWEVICHLIVNTLSESDLEMRKNDAKRSPDMELNLENLVGILGHMVEIYSFSSVGFASEVGWIYGSSFTNASTIILADNQYWAETFWTCFACSVGFVILLFPASKYIKIGRLGLNEDLTPAGITSPQFYLSKFIGLFGKVLYFTILAAMLNAFSCSYSDGTWHLMRDSSVICFSEQHSVYLVLAIATLLFYYPTATLLYPNITYQDKSLDLKFDTTYLVMESQGKLIIAGFFAFFAKEIYIWLQLIVSIIVSSVLFAINFKTKPCMIESYNVWKTGGFAVPIWICSCALINYYSGEHVVAIVLLTSGLGVLLGILIAVYAKKYGFKCLKNVKSSNNERNSNNLSQMKINSETSQYVASNNFMNNTALPGIEAFMR